MHIVTIFIWFILYSMMGWIMETFYCSLKSLKWNNRGMLMGPYCPIWGVGAILDILICGGQQNPWIVFYVCMFGSAILEYVTSYATERLFHAVWWDYSRLPFNLNGRICLSCSLSFGIGGIAVLYGVQPYMVMFTNAIPLLWQEVIALLFMAFFAVDCALTADSLISLNVKLDAAIKAIDSQISERYETFIENTKQNLSEGIGKRKASLEEYREHRMREEMNKTLSGIDWKQAHVLRSSVSFRQSKYSEFGSRVKNAIMTHKKE